MCGIELSKLTENTLDGLYNSVPLSMDEKMIELVFEWLKDTCKDSQLVDLCIDYVDEK